MTNTVANGEVFDYVNSTGSDIASGAVVVMGDTVGIAVTKIVDGDKGAVNVCGAYNVTSAGYTGSQGDKVYWDTVALEATDTPSGDTVIMGVLYKDVAPGDTTLQVKLTTGGGSVALATQAANVANLGAATITAVPGTFADVADVRTYLLTLVTDLTGDFAAARTTVNGTLSSLQAADIMA